MCCAVALCCAVHCCAVLCRALLCCAVACCATGALCDSRGAHTRALFARSGCWWAPVIQPVRSGRTPRTPICWRGASLWWVREGVGESECAGAPSRVHTHVNTHACTHVQVDNRSDRMGVRLAWPDQQGQDSGKGEAREPEYGEARRPVGGQVLSEGRSAFFRFLVFLWTLHAFFLSYSPAFSRAALQHTELHWTVSPAGAVRGTIQLPPDGAPIVLLADHQATGG